MGKYITLDKALLEFLTPVPKPFAILFSEEIKAECNRIAAGESNPQSFRILDRRLQALRKAGRIQYTTGKGWLKCGGPV